MKRQLFHRFEDIISPENLLAAWREFVRGKRHKRDVQEFGLRLMDNILELHLDLQNKTYRHGPYQHFRINDPKPRDIHKATVRDRIVHHAIHRVLYWFCHQVFITDSFSCRLGKGTHKAMNRFRAFAYHVSHNHTKTLWALKCDIRKFFASIDQTILLSILKERIPDENIIWLLDQVIHSFHSTCPGTGLPLGNLTSQLFVNIYMNEFDQFVKHGLRQRHYLRYADDFVFMHHDKDVLTVILSQAHDFLEEKLKLTLHPDKIFLKTATSGVDFLGCVHFYHHRALRTTTKKRMFRKIIETSKRTEVVQSYLELLRHGNTHRLKQEFNSKIARKMLG